LLTKDRRESPVFCISIVTAMSPVLYKVTSKYFSSNPVRTILDGASKVAWTVVHKILAGKQVSVATVSRGGKIFCGPIFARVSYEEDAGKR
jgi:hypothetical protein